MRRILLSLCLCITSTAAFTQALPDEMYFSPDNRILYTGGRPSTGLYDQSVIRNIYLTFSQANYWSQLQSNYSSKTDLPATLSIDGLTYDSVGVRFKGQTSYNTGTSQKKSFNITSDAFIDGQEVMGYNIMNLNNCFQDPSFMREIVYQNLIRRHIPAAKSAYVKLYINGANWGLYPNVQQLNKDFLKEWFLTNDGTNWRADRPTGGPGGGGWGDGTAALNYLGNDTSDYKQYYTLKSTDSSNPWDLLLDATHVLDTVSSQNMMSVLSDYIDVDRSLWFLASEVMFSDDDGYIYKGKMDYYVYHEPETGRLTPLEYDGNSVMDPSHVNWSVFYNANNANYPLMNRLMAVPEIRQRYLAHMRTLLSESFDPVQCGLLIDSYKSVIDTMVQNDPKKLYSYTSFNNEIADLKDFISDRHAFISSNAEVNRTGPSITNVNYTSTAGAWLPPAATEAVNVTAEVSSANGLDRVTLYYATGLVGKFAKVTMQDDGAHNDGAAGDGIYGGTIPGQSGGQWVRFYIEAAAADAAFTVSYNPPGAEHDIYIYQVVPSVATSKPVVINEIMASNSMTAADSSGEYDDWVEIYNPTGSAQDISGYILTDNSLNLLKWQFPAGTVIQPNDYLIAWLDEDAGQGDMHVNFKLSADGERLMLLNPALEIVDDVTFGQQTTDMGYARVPNGTGNFVIQAPTFSGNNDLSTGINSVAVAGISIYPNPANEQMRIYAGGSQSYDLQVFNSIGEMVYNTTFISSVELNTSEWKNGIYVVRCGKSIRKVVISH